MKKNIVILLCVMLLFTSCGKGKSDSEQTQVHSYQLPAELSIYGDTVAIGQEILLAAQSQPLSVAVLGPATDDDPDDNSFLEPRKFNGELVEISQIEIERLLSIFQLSEWERVGAVTRTFNPTGSPFSPVSLAIPGDWVVEAVVPATFELLISYKDIPDFGCLAAARRITPDSEFHGTWHLYKLPDGVVDNLRVFEAELVKTHNLTFPNTDRKMR
ncbi:MAG: hypothetical protein FWG10_14585 [Eubacteriaceae bacterium]|nr:hypothetical protein [Eubacteriaceae bacterium]